jgi:DNA-directed RNA polymerase subunit H (RpoH/RPB5)
MTEEMLKEFFTKLMEEHKLLQEGEEGEVITEVQINLEKLYAFLEVSPTE